MKRFALFFVLLLPLASFAAEPAPAIRLPMLPAPPTPAPVPAQVTKLTAGQLYVITADSPILVLASRDGFVKITALKTPITVFGSFIDAMPGDEDGRSYATGFVYVVRAVATGQIELLVTPDITGKNVIRRVIDVEGPGPTPPGPGPQPQPVDPLVKSLQDAYDKDTDAGKAIKLSALQGIMQEAAGQSLDPAVTTTQALGNAVHAVTEQKVGKDALKNTRDAVGAFLNANLPPLTKTPITDVDRQKASAGYAKIATALKGVKP